MELIIRAAVVYAFVFLLLRISGKRQFAQISTFDFVLLLVLSEGVSQGLFGEDDFSLTAAFLVVTAFVGLDVILSQLKRASSPLEKVIEGVPVLLVDEGVVNRQMLNAHAVDEADVLEAGRLNFGLESLDQVKFAILERNGNVSIVPWTLPYLREQDGRTR